MVSYVNLRQFLTKVESKSDDVKTHLNLVLLERTVPRLSLTDAASFSSIAQAIAWVDIWPRDRRNNDTFIICISTKTTNR